MNCPFCETDSETFVRETRVIEDGKKVVRRRECKLRGHRFRTTESVGELLVKKDAGHLEPFDKAKIAEGIETALYKRKSDRERSKLAWEAAAKIEDKLLAGLGDRDSVDVDRTEVGQLVLEHLKTLDWLGRLRYLSVFLVYKRGVSERKRQAVQQQVDALLDQILTPPEPQPR